MIKHIKTKKQPSEFSDIFQQLLIWKDSEPMIKKALRKAACRLWAGKKGEALTMVDPEDAVLYIFKTFLNDKK